MARLALNTSLVATAVGSAEVPVASEVRDGSSVQHMANVGLFSKVIARVSQELLVPKPNTEALGIVDDP